MANFILQPASQLPQPPLLSAAERLILKYLRSAGGAAPLKSLCLSVLPGNRQLLLRALDRLARRGEVVLKADGTHDLTVRLAGRPEGGAQ